jgi:hypothetical protein
VSLDTKQIKIDGGNTATLKFNGENAYVKSKNIFDFNNKTTYNPNKKLTIFVSFHPDDVKLNINEKEDIMTVFSIPGYDCSITYNSYRRYTFQIFNNKKNIVYIHSDILPNYKTNMTITVDNEEKTVSVYQNGDLIDSKSISDFYDYSNSDYFYLGCTKIDNKLQNFFRGTISLFAVYNDILEYDEIIELSKNQFFGLTQNFGNYRSDYKLVLYYDAKFIKGYQLIDLCDNKNNGFINNCEIVGFTYDNHQDLKVPYRRECEFELIPHEENGYENGSWKHETTRYNQLRFHNEVLTGNTDLNNDGLNNCTYKEYGKSHVENIIHINVEI